MFLSCISACCAHAYSSLNACTDSPLTRKPGLQFDLCFLSVRVKPDWSGLAADCRFAFPLSGHDPLHSHTSGF